MFFGHVLEVCISFNFVTLGLHSVAQNRHSLHTRLALLDSLVLYNKMEEAVHEAHVLNSLLAPYTHDKQLLDLRWSVLLHQAKLSTIKEEFPRSLALSFEIIDLASAHKRPDHQFAACLNAALVYEIGEYQDLSKTYLDKARELHQLYKLDHLYSTYCVRVASYYRFNNQRDSAIYFAHKAMEFAKEYGNRKDASDAYLLLTVLSKNKDEAIKYGLLAAASFREINGLRTASAMYSNIATIYVKKNRHDGARFYNEYSISIDTTAGQKKKAAMYYWRNKS